MTFELPQSLLDFHIPYSILYVFWNFSWNKNYIINQICDESSIHLGLFPFSLFCLLVEIYNELHVLNFTLGEDPSMNDVDFLCAGIWWIKHWHVMTQLLAFPQNYGNSWWPYVLIWNLENSRSHLLRVYDVFIHLYVTNFNCLDMFRLELHLDSWEEYFENWAF